jgi:predicted kinase
MGRHNLIILCGVPGSGKSALAQHLVSQSGAVSFASETFADQLGAAGRTSSGELTRQARDHAYSAMAVAVTTSLVTSKLVVVVGSFRAELQRSRFRDIAREMRAKVTTLRVVCPAATAAERVRLRRAHGEPGPTEQAIRQIEAELNQANDIDGQLTNDTSIDDFFRRADTIMKFLMRDSQFDLAAAMELVEDFERIAAHEFARARASIDPRGLGRTQVDQNNAAVAIGYERERSRARIQELEKCLLLGLPRPVGSNLQMALQRASEKWVDKVNQLGMVDR